MTVHLVFIEIFCTLITEQNAPGVIPFYNTSKHMKLKKNPYLSVGAAITETS